MNSGAAPYPNAIKPVHTFTILRCNFALEALEDIPLPAYKGSTFHGGLGRALMQLSPRWYKILFTSGPEEQADLPKPFTLLPPLDPSEIYLKGQPFCCTLTLFGDAARQHALYEAAIEYLGGHMGLGEKNGKFKVLNILYDTYTSAPVPATSLQQLTLNFQTRLRLKSNDCLQRRAPDFSLLITRLHGRIKTLNREYGEKPADFVLPNLDQAELKRINVLQSTLKWDEWSRYSGSQQQWMKFGGLLGSITYQGDLTAYYELLNLGAWVHLGGKTSFGLGHYQLLAPGEGELS